MKNLMILLAGIVFLFGSCKKDERIRPGTYTGTFTVSYNGKTETGPVTLELKRKKYSCSSNTNHVPAGGSGTWSASKGKITFRDENTWTADFDWRLILDGEYTYEVKDKKLILYKANSLDLFRYELERN